ncbi:MAG: hypothetical protein ACLUD0_17510 [Eubacterium ramulus]
MEKSGISIYHTVKDRKRWYAGIYHAISRKEQIFIQALTGSR